jgi:hypothetical protein
MLVVVVVRSVRDESINEADTIYYRTPIFYDEYYSYYY